MIAETVDRLRVTMQQMGRLISALDDLKGNILPKDPHLFAVMSEGPLEDLGRLKEELQSFVDEVLPTAAGVRRNVSEMRSLDSSWMEHLVPVEKAASTPSQVFIEN